MITFDDLRFFAKVAGASTLAALARELDVTPPAVTQRLKQVEARAGVRLIDRTTRQLTLTQEGELIAARGQAILNDMDDLADGLAARRDGVAGHLRVLAPLPFGRRFVAPTVARFQAAYPDVKIDLFLSDRPNVATRDSFDVTIHIGDLPDSNLRLRQLAPNRRFLCASPGYLKRRGEPQSPDDLRRHDCIAIRENNEDVTMWRLRKNGKTTHIRINPRLACNEGEVARNWALTDCGIILRSEWDVADQLATGRLVHLLPEFSLPDANVVALLGHHHGRAARTTKFLETLAAALTPTPWRPAMPAL